MGPLWNGTLTIGGSFLPDSDLPAPRYDHLSAQVSAQVFVQVEQEQGRIFCFREIIV